MHFVLVASLLFCLIYNVPTGEAYGHFGLINFFTMTYCRLRVNGLCYYNGYGCYCGLGGSGTPVDGIDRCCMEHDKCYGEAVTKGGCLFEIQQYLARYHYVCIRHRPYCLKAKNNPCRQWICECDRAAVNCFAKYPLPTTKPICKDANTTTTPSPFGKLDK
ncbi:hypothetical protein AB6A40_010679 [Gnathostoma spinigerum]|uniref:Phospholipase A2 n=1 Tax=Gnathostoma spinigerum TaxID=75299 RepID=A0ABD6F3P2_9BILA